MLKLPPLLILSLLLASCVSMSVRHCNEAAHALCVNREKFCDSTDADICQDVMSNAMRCDNMVHVPEGAFINCEDDISTAQQCLVGFPASCERAFYLPEHYRG